MADFDELNLAELNDEAERLESQGNQDFLKNFVRMPEKAGYVTVRLLPKAKGKNLFCSTRTHKLDDRNVHCTKTLTNGRWIDADPKRPCVICKYYNDLWKDIEKLEKAGRKKEAEEIKIQARAIKPVDRYYYNVIARSQLNRKTNAPEVDVGPLIYSCGKTMHQKIIRGIVGDPSMKKKGYGDVTNPKTGRDLCIRKRLKGEGKDAYPEYDESDFEDQTPLGNPDQIDKWINSLHDLDSLRVLKTVEEMEVMLEKYLDGEPAQEEQYDISKFRNKRKKAPSLEEQVNAATSTATTTVTAAPPKPTVTATPATPTPVVAGTPPPEDAAMTEQDFMEELRRMQS
jgi:hypothetical protein